MVGEDDKADRFSELARWAASLSWPISESQADELVAERGWPLLHAYSSGSGGVYDSGLNDTRAWASLRMYEGHLAEINIFTAFVPPGDETRAPGFITDEFAEQVAVAETVLGASWSRTPGIDGDVTWNLPGQAELRIGRTARSCQWGINSPEYTELLRTPDLDDE